MEQDIHRKRALLVFVILDLSGEHMVSTTCKIPRCDPTKTSSARHTTEAILYVAPLSSLQRGNK